MTKELWQMVGLYLTAVNLAGFCLMGIDKRRAKKKAWRVREKALFLPAVLGGAAGALLGMKVFRHKTRHWYFKFGMPFILLVQVAFAGWLMWRAVR